MESVRAVAARRLKGWILGPALAVLAVALNSVSADVVSRDAYRTWPSGSMPGGAFARPSFARPGSRASFDVSLDLSGYRDAAVTFNFASLISKDPSGFTVSSAGAGTSYLDGFRLLSPARSSFVRTGADRFVRLGRPTGFRHRGGGRTFTTAMFNLAAFDGQTVLLSVAFDGRAASRRGIVNLENLSIDVHPVGAGAAPTAAAVPEPASVSLLLAASLAFFAGRYRKKPVRRA
jgi:hypothetical protein